MMQRLSCHARDSPPQSAQPPVTASLLQDQPPRCVQGGQSIAGRHLPTCSDDEAEAAGPALQFCSSPSGSSGSSSLDMQGILRITHLDPWHPRCSPGSYPPWPAAALPCIAWLTVLDPAMHLVA